jgi:hypothetical protein
MESESDGATGPGAEKKRAVGQASKSISAHHPLAYNASVISAGHEKLNVTRPRHRAQIAVDPIKVRVASLPFAGSKHS